MSIKTIRFNKEEDLLLKKVLSYYQKDFSTCVKELLAEKLEDLKDIQSIQRIKEADRNGYYTAYEITSMFKRSQAA